MELNTTGQKEHALLLESLWLLVLMSAKCRKKRLIKVRSFPDAACTDMYRYLVPIIEKKTLTL